MNSQLLSEIKIFVKTKAIEQRATFKKEEKLKSLKLIETLFIGGSSFSNFPFRVMYLFLEKNIAPLQAGFAVSGKHFKKAVDRNRVKRLMREAYRLQKHELDEALTIKERCLIVFFIYTGNELPSYIEVEKKIHSVLKRVNKIVDEVTDANT